MQTPAEFFPGFSHSVKELDQFIVILDFFTIVLKDGNIIKHTPDNYFDFLDWLEANGVTNIRKTDKWELE